VPTGESARGISEPEKVAFREVDCALIVLINDLFSMAAFELHANFYSINQTLGLVSQI
jgi:hypothetical protein